MNCDATTHPAASTEAPEDRVLKARVTNVSLAQNGQGTVRGLSLATLAAALAACGGGGSGGPAAPATTPATPTPAAPANNAPEAKDVPDAMASASGETVTGDAVGTDEDDDTLTYTVTKAGMYGELKHDENGWTYAADPNNDKVRELGAGDTLTDTAEVEVSDGEADAATATITITITGVNDAPSIEVAGGGDSDSTAAGVTASFTVAENAPDAIPGAAGPVLGLITLSDPDMGDTHTVTVDDDRFQVIRHPAEGMEGSSLWLTLKPGVTLDYEASASIDLTLTVTDAGGLTGTADVTITVTNANEGPAVTAPDPIIGEAGKALGDDGEGVMIDLLKVFSDPDGDFLRYTMTASEDVAKWLDFSNKSGTDGDGKPFVHGHLTGTPPAGSDKPVTVTITATDPGGNSADASVQIVLDDGNDPIQSVELLDADGNPTLDTEVNENDDTGKALGEIRVVDPDDAMHPNGDIKIDILKFGQADAVIRTPKAELDDRFEVRYDDAGVPWLAIVAGKSFDREDPKADDPTSVDIIIRAVDLGGQKSGKAPAEMFDGTIRYQQVTVDIIDQNDAPKANPIGNWWVTAEDGQDAEDVNKGDWLTFALDTDGPDAAFTDPDGDKLTYTLSGTAAAILEIDKDGNIQNKKGALPIEGNHDLTVTAKDPAGLEAKSTFHVAIALSGDGTDATADEDNDEPDFSNPQENDYTEGTGDQIVATFTVTDEDNGLGHHPFTLDKVEITQLVVKYQDSNTDDLPVDATSTSLTGMEARFNAAFHLSDPRKSGDVWAYDLLVKDTNKDAKVDTTAILNHEVIDSVEVTVRATDGIATPAPTETIDVEINDANEKPAKASNYAGPGSANVTVPETGGKTYLWIKLNDFWEDEDRRDGDDDLTFTASVNAPWMKVLHKPQPWRDIEDGADGDSGTTDDIVWGRIGTVTADNAGSEPTDDGDHVVVIEIDRTGANALQAHVGGDFAVTLTARDDRGGPLGTETIKVVVEDISQAIPATAKPLKIEGAAREGQTLKAVFDENADPDLVGGVYEAYNLLYTWSRVTFNSDGTDDEVTVVQVGRDDKYMLTQADVDHNIRVDVTYTQLQGIEFVTDSVAEVAAVTTEGVVRNTPDRGVAFFDFGTIHTDSSEAIFATSFTAIVDEDVVPTGNNAPTYTWQQSDNGRGGWTNVASDTDTSDRSLSLTDGEGKYYRLVVEYTDNQGARERIESEAIKVSKLEAPAEAMQPVMAGAYAVGGTLRVNIREAKDGITYGVQWQQLMNGAWMDIAGATSETLVIAKEYAGTAIRALVTRSDKDGITAIFDVYKDSSDPTAAIDQLTNTLPTKVKDYEIESTGMIGQSGTATVEVMKFPNGATVTKVMDTVPVASLFSDLDGDKLTFTVTAGPGSRVTGDGIDDSIWYTQTSSIGTVGLFLDAKTGELLLISDELGGHDGDAADEDGNMVAATITASDGREGTATANVNIRLNVAPTDIHFADGQSEADIANVSLQNGADGGTFALNVDEQTADSDVLIAHLDVQDENMPTHKFGTHTITVSDDRFIVKHTGGGEKDTDGNGSTWELYLKKGAVLDFEKAADKSIVLKFMVTDGGGLAMPTGVQVSTLTISVQNVSNADGDTNDVVPPDLTNVPGLEDDEPGDSDERADGGDTDTDGGAHSTQMDAMMMSSLDDGLF